MAREQARKRTSSNNQIDRRTYLRLSSAVAVGAAATTLDSTTDSALDNRLSIVGTSPEPTTYEVTVTDEIVPDRDTDALSSLGTTGRSAEDALASGVRQYRFSGEIADLRLGEGAVALVNGVRLDTNS
jgi:hypothetical protein